MSDGWKELSKGRVFKKHPLGFLIVRPAEEYVHVPIGCPVCGMMMRDEMDSRAYHKYQCCRECIYKWAQPRIDEWKEGWRPAGDEITEELCRRKSTKVYFVK